MKPLRGQPLALIKEGYTVYAAARRVEPMKDLRELGGFPLKMDVTQEDEMVAAVERIEKNHGAWISRAKAFQHGCHPY